MSGFAGVCRSAALVPLGLLLCLFVAVPALSYTGGPTRAHVAGLEPHEQRVYYYLTFHGGAWSKPEVWFFDLEGENPEKPIRAQSLEARDKDWWKDEHGISDAWRSLSSGFEPLTPLAQFNLEMSLCADSIAQDSPGGCPRYMGHLVLEGEGLGQAIDLKMFCNTLVQVRGVYSLPERSELVMFVSYTANPSDCGELDLPIVIYSD
jgi:hypothetical protein